MDNLWQRINEDLKKAMLQKDEETLNVLRMILAEMKNKMIELKEKESLVDDKAMEVLKSSIKKRKDSIELYEKGDRQDLADKEKKEIEIIEKYLPEQMSDEELEKIIKDIIGSMGEVSQKDFGKIMGQVMAKTKGQADGNKVSEIVKKVLSN